MISCALLMGSLLATANPSQPAEVVQIEMSREKLAIDFAWQSTEKWQVEIRENQFRQGTPPTLPLDPWKVEAVESLYRPDLQDLFEQGKNQER
jgi:hypothetical protein